MPLQRVHHGLLLAQWVKQRRSQLGLTQAEVAERMGFDVDTGWVTQLEVGQKKTMISQPWLGLLARALSASELEILHGAGVITEPLPEPGAPRDPFPRGDRRAKVVDLLACEEPSSSVVLGFLEVLERLHPDQSRAKGS